MAPAGLRMDRDRILSYLDDLYARRLKLPDSHERLDAAAAVLDDPRGILIEMAHDGQLPHLGIVRMVLKACEVAETAGNGLALYLVGDHYTPNMRPQNLLLGLPLRGVDADRVKNPLTIPVGRRYRHIPFHRLPPPSTEALNEVARRGQAWVVNNASHVDRKAALSEIKARLDAEMERLQECARLTLSFGDWLMRVQITWFDDLLGGTPANLAILPMSGIMDWMPDVLHALAEADDEVARIKNRVSAAQAAKGERSYLSDDGAAGLFWVYCPTCWRRYRTFRDGDRFHARCTSCAEPIEARWPGDGRLMPDIVAFELALFRTGLSGWIVGSRAPYHPVIEESYRALFHAETPPKGFLTSIPRFHGVGEPPEGHTRARLLRVLLEVEPRVVREALQAPWEENPEITSRYL